MFLSALLGLLPTLTTFAAPEAPLPTSEPAVPLPDGETSDQGWSGGFTLGASIASGNNETKSASATFDAEWKGDPDRLTLGALWNYQEEEVVTQRKVYGVAQYDRFFSEKAYGFAQTSGDYDYQAGLDLRWIGGVGGGYQFLDDATWKVNGELGLSYVKEDFRTGLDDDYPAARAAYSVSWNDGGKWEVSNAGEIYPSLEDANDVYARMETRVKVTLTEAMFAQLGWLMDWDNTPASGKERVDHLFTLTLGWGF